MLRSLLCLSIAVSIVVPLPAFSQEVQSGTDANQKLPIIRSTTRLVNLSVLVNDSKGQPVQGLSKDDFQVFDNGHAEEIAFFSTRDDTGAASSGVRSLGPGEYTNNPRRPGVGDEGATIILFDTVHTAYLSQAYSLGRIRKFLRQLQPQDRVGIYVLSENGLKVVYDLDQPASVLLEAIQRYDEAHSGGSASKTTAAAENSTGLVELDRFLQGKDDYEPMRRCDPERFRIIIAAYQEIARRTLGLRGRKAVIWVTENMPWSFGDENALDYLRGMKGCGMDYDPDLLLEDPANLRPMPGAVRDRGLSDNDEMDLLLRLLNQNNIVLYPVSAEGLQTVRLFGPGGADTTAPLEHDQGAMTKKVLAAVDAVANVYQHQHMEEAARRTGGRAYYNRNDLETGIRRALDDRKYGYELAYYPDHDGWNGDWRKIKVKVDRPKVTVLAREGYYAFPEAKLLPPKASKQLLEEIAASPLQDTEILITLKLTRPGVGSSPVEARVYLSAQNLFTSHQPESWTTDFEVLFFQLTIRNKILDVTTQTVNVELTQAKYREALKRGIDTLERLQLKPGAALLYVIVHDKRTDAVGSVRIPLDQYATTLQRTELPR